MELPAQCYRIPLKLHVTLNILLQDIFLFLLSLATLSSQFWTEQNFMAVPGRILCRKMIIKDLSAVSLCLANWWWQTEEINEADEAPVLCVSQQLKVKIYPKICVLMKFIWGGSCDSWWWHEWNMETSLARWKALPLALLQGTFFLCLCFEDCHGVSQIGVFPLIWSFLGDSKRVGGISKRAENWQSRFP